jgi:magnesium-transporting ATPase (P-type)
VDTATDIAKESADLILLEKDLMVLEGGVIEGRKVFANIVKYIRMGASSNFGNMFSVLGASAFLPFLPMAPIQVLTNNLLYDFSQVPIPADAVDEEQVAVRGPGTSGKSNASFSLSARSARFSTIRPSSSCSTSSTAGIHPERRSFRPAGSSSP